MLKNNNDNNLRMERIEFRHLKMIGTCVHDSHTIARQMVAKECCENKLRM